MIYLRVFFFCMLASTLSCKKSSNPEAQPKKVSDTNGKTYSELIVEYEAVLKQVDLYERFQKPENYQKVTVERAITEFEAIAAEMNKSAQDPALAETARKQSEDLAKNYAQVAARLREFVVAVEKSLGR